MLGPRPRNGGVGRVLFVRTPSPGCWERLRFGAPCFHWAASMITFDSLDKQLADLGSNVRSCTEDWRALSLPPSVGLWEWRPQSGTICFSPAWADLLRLDDIGEAGRLGEYMQHVHPDDRALLTLTMVGFVLGAEKYASRHRMLHGDGSERQFLSRDVLVTSEHGRPARVIIADFDITGCPHVDS